MSNARDTARRVLRRVHDGAWATLALGGELGRVGSAQDRALCTELVYGVLKQRRRLDWALAARAPRGLGSLDETVLDALRLGAYQILFLRIPAHAAVDDAVDAIKRLRSPKLAGFANAVLRGLAKDGEPPPPGEPVARLGVETSAPDWLVADALARFSPEEAALSLHAWNQPAPVWLRVQTGRATVAEAAKRLQAERPDGRVTISATDPEAIRIDSGGDPAATATFGEGWVTAQDLAAQRVAHLCEPVKGLVVLDGCAGVGGKSTHLLQLGASRVDAADLSARKLELASDSARRLGLGGLRPIVANLTDKKAPIDGIYDVVLVDAPCSGLGVLRRHPEAKWRPKPELRALAATQSAILDALAQRVRPGGALVYSVCTFTDEEGPQVIAGFLRAHPEFSVDGPPLSTWPHRDDADAFFAQRLRRARPQ